MSKILVFAGSARKDSLNKKLAAHAATQVEKHGAQATFVDLADYPLPIYDGDLETADGIPDNAAALRHLMLEHDGFLISCPEYNGSITPLLKNVIDWTSRPADGAPMTAATRGKTVALVSASPGGFGGMRGLVHVRAILSGIGALVIPQTVSVGGAHQVFDENGALTDEKLDQRLDGTVQALIQTTSALSDS